MRYLKNRVFFGSVTEKSIGNLPMIIEMTTSVLICYGFATRGTSDAARRVSEQIQTSRQHLQRSFSLGLEGKGVFNELCAVAEECQAPNWDAQGAAPVTEETYKLAYRFLESLPLGIPAPSVGAEPDGHLTLEWHRSPRRTLSVSVSPESDLQYAALLGAGKAYGTEPFLGDAPKAVLDLVYRVMWA
jgi:hypothetical protein